MPERFGQHRPASRHPLLWTHLAKSVACPSAALARRRYDLVRMELLVLVLIPMFFVAAILCLATLPRVHFKEQCTACGYPRAGLDSTPTCPECGHVNDAVLEPSLRKVAASRQHERWLMAAPILLGQIGAAAMLPAVLTHGSIVAAAALALLSAVLTIPPALLGLLAAGRTSTAAAWTISLSGGLPVLAIGSYSGLSYLASPDRTYAAFNFLAVIAVGAISCGLCGLVGCIAGAMQHHRLTRLRRKSPRSAQTEPNRT